jgi:hypothetical protein
VRRFKKIAVPTPMGIPFLKNVKASDWYQGKVFNKKKIQPTSLHFKTQP